MNNFDNTLNLLVFAYNIIDSYPLSFLYFFYERNYIIIKNYI